MKNIMDKHSIIKLKMEGESNRSVAKLLNINRKTVSRYWNEYLNHQKELQNPNSDIAEVQEKIVSAPKYDSSNRKARKYTKEIDIALAEILFGERKKIQF